MKHSVIPQPYDDPHGIGQRRLAEIAMELSMKEMGENWQEAFGLQYENPLWRAARRRIFYRAREAHDRAKSILLSLELAQ